MIFFQNNQMVLSMANASYKTVHYSITAFIFSPYWKSYFIKPSQFGESLSEYMKNVDAGEYLSCEKCNYLAELGKK